MLQLAVLSVLLSACAAKEVIQTPPIPKLSNQPSYDIERIDPLAMSPEMKQFVESQLSKKSSRDDKAWKLAYASMDPWILDFDYDPHITLTASEAFHTRRGNCLTFSNMFIAMARYAGLDAWYREVEIEPEWDSREDTLLVSLHVNAATRNRGMEYVIDVSRRPVREGERYRRISDREAEAQLYNNLGAHALVKNDLPTAYAYFRLAEETMSGLPYIWSNLGVVLNRNEQVEDAILAYETALQLDGRHSVSLNNLYSIYEEQGDLEKAQKLQQQVERNRRKNPYYMHYLSEVAFSELRWDEAIDYAKRAIRLEDTEYSFYYTLAQLQYQTGKADLAESNLRIAKNLAPEWVDTGELVLPGEFPEIEPDN